MHLQRQRYLLFEYFFLDSNEIIKEKEIIRAIWTSIVKLFGEYGAFKTGLWMIEYDPLNHWGILRCNNITKEKVITSLAFIRQIKSTNVVFHTIKTSGTIKKIKEIQKQFFIKHRNMHGNKNAASN